MILRKFEVFLRSALLVSVGRRLTMLLLLFVGRRHVSAFLATNIRNGSNGLKQMSCDVKYQRPHSFLTNISRLVSSVHRTRDVDIVETLIGGVRFENVPIPNAMKETTLFVGNLCEFVKDEDLSTLFRSVSKLQSLPACVARKADTSSLQYGFVSFPSVEEKEQAIIKFHNLEWRGKRLKVEEIKESSKSRKSVLIPERMVDYVTGGKSLEFVSKKKTNPVSSKKKTNPVALCRITKDDVDRLSRGQASKQRGYGSRGVPHRLNEEERAEFDRAMMRGYLTLTGGGNRRARKGSPLANIHRQWCDARAKPQIMLFKATYGKSIDEIVIDVSPLRLHGMFDNQSTLDGFLTKWKTQTVTAAVENGMEIRDIEMNDDNDEDDETSVEEFKDLMTINVDAWATKPIWQLPVVELGIFEGDRTSAKAMAKALGNLWEIPEDSQQSSPVESRSAKQPDESRSAKQTQRKRGGGHRQEWHDIS